MVLPRRPPRRACKTRPEAMTLLGDNRPPVRHYAGLVGVIKPAIACPPQANAASSFRSYRSGPISRTSGWFEPERLGGDATTEKTVGRHSVSRRTIIGSTADLNLGGALQRLDVRVRSKNKIIGIETFRPLPARPLDLRRADRRLDGTNHRRSDAVLKVEDIR
jgi:hypothetical protein